MIDSSNKCTGVKMYALTDNLLDVSVMVYILCLLGSNSLNRIYIIAVMNCLIDNTNIRTSVYQIYSVYFGVHLCICWYYLLNTSLLLCYEYG